MSTEQKLSDEQLSARYRSQDLQSPPALDERVLALARERVPQATPRSWLWAGIAVVCVLVLWVPGLLESPAPVTDIAELRDNMRAPESLTDEYAAPGSAAMLKSDATALSKRAASELHSTRQREQPVEATVSAAGPDLDARATAAPTMADAVPAESVADAAAGEAAIHPASEAWLQKIAGLLAADDLIGAQAAFAEFRQVYPEAEVDAALLERLAIKP